MQSGVAPCMQVPPWTAISTPGLPRCILRIHYAGCVWKHTPCQQASMPLHMSSHAHTRTHTHTCLWPTRMSAAFTWSLYVSLASHSACPTARTSTRHTSACRRRAERRCSVDNTSSRPGAAGGGKQGGKADGASTDTHGVPQMVHAAK